MRIFFDRLGGLHWHVSDSWWKLLLAVGLVFPAQWATSQAVVLREVVETSRGTIRLSDLLPAGAPLAVRSASATAELGRSPQPGSMRVLDRTQIARSLTGQPDLLRLLAIPDRILVRRTGWPLEQAAIREAVERFLGERSDRRRLLGSVLQSPDELIAWAQNPALEVFGIRRDVRGHGFELRLRCAQPALCSSFVVQLLTSQPVPDRSLPLDRAAGSLAFRGSPAVAVEDAAPVLARAGKKAMLRLDDGRMSISLPVICLEPGRLAQKIRVLDVSSRRILRAEVVGAGQLHANL